MKKPLFLILTCLLLPIITVASIPSDSLLRVLKSEIARNASYDLKKDQQIAVLKFKLKGQKSLNFKQRYSITLELFEAFQDYRFDSTFKYAKQLVNLSTILHDDRLLAENRLRMGTTLIASGMFKETFDCLREINVGLLDNNAKKKYYILSSWAWSDLSKYNEDRFYTPENLDKKYRYLDSAIALTDKGSFEQLILLAQQDPKSGSNPSRYYLELLKRKLSPHEEAMVVTGLSRYRTGQEKVRLLAIAAINDVQSSTYRAQALLDLGNTLYQQGDIEDAYYFLRQAMRQADKFGSRMQRYQVARLLPMVDEKRDKVHKQGRERFIIVLSLVSIVAVITGLIGFIIFFQLRTVRAADVVIREKNDLLARQNIQLFEDSKIKEEYIGFFFSEISRHILKLDRLKNNAHRRIKSGSIEEALHQLEKVDIQGERRQLFATFDKVFLKLFPDFISVVNSMLNQDNQLKPKADGTLTMQLRILALMRLGIHNNERIALILESTVNTVYTYRLRLKSKAIMLPESFEQRIMGIQIAENEQD
jgi:tetratricopeptide (TPR) repeat protein